VILLSDLAAFMIDDAGFEARQRGSSLDTSIVNQNRASMCLSPRLGLPCAGPLCGDQIIQPGENRAAHKAVQQCPDQSYDRAQRADVVAQIDPAEEGGLAGCSAG
jgi:hypothetical protein